ncbi:MAG: hypothetical protein M5U22_14295 [Thermoleophilia bacterium]|nr:hypothetical protein [Thermoleophilia bacterium]
MTTTVPPRESARRKSSRSPPSGTTVRGSRPSTRGSRSTEAAATGEITPGTTSTGPL